MKGHSVWASIVAGAAVAGLSLGADEGDEPTASLAVDVGSRLELFVDDWLIDGRQNVHLRLHGPVRREVVLHFDAPWEGAVSGYVGLFRDGNPGYWHL